jgi:formiminoglutamase
MPIKAHWIPTATDLFFTRNDPNDLRWGDYVLPTDPFEKLNTAASYKQDQPPAFGLWGYADEEGIARNGGRIGARFAPDFIRRFLYRLTPHLDNVGEIQVPRISDLGNWQRGPSLEHQIDVISPVLAQLLAHHPMITLGGGHDYGAVDGLGFLKWCKTATPQIKPLIINFDAHLDVRPWRKGLNSGTPFSWLIENSPCDFDFLEVGIQKHCSSPHHHQWLKGHGGNIIDLEWIHQVGLLTALRQYLAGTPAQQPCFISLDIDVFTQHSAPGCSQSWEAGLDFAPMQEALLWLMRNRAVRLFGLYEVSPPLDIDHRTSKLAACLIHELLQFRT